MILELLRAFAFIFIAEMGDKTQILAMAFATKYSIKKVLLGIFLGSLLNHGLAVLLGNSLTRIIDPNTLQIIAGFTFVLFALWSLKMNDDEEEVKTKVKFGPVITVALAFFIGELGDKTQLTAITLSASADFPLFILMGTVLGMLVTGALGIYVGIKMGNKIPELFIKLGAAIIFFIFGFLKLTQSLPNEFLSFTYVISFIIVISLLAYLILIPTIKGYKTGALSLYKKTAEQLQYFYSDIAERLEDICLGQSVCGVCSGSKCLIGYTKELIRNAENNVVVDLEYIELPENTKNFDKAKVLQSLKLTIVFLKSKPNKEAFRTINMARMNFERILFGNYISDFDNYDSYKVELFNLNKGKFNL